MLIRNGHVLNVERDALEVCDLIVEGGAIADLCPAGAVTDANAEIFDAGRYLLLPGLINCHTHSTGNLAKGLGERWTLEIQLNATNFLYRDRTTDEKYLSALIGALDMVSGGCTACYDLVFEWPAPTLDGLTAVAGAYDEVGLRAVVAPMLASQSFYRAVPGLSAEIPRKLAEEGDAASSDLSRDLLARCAEILKRWPNKPRARPGLAPSIPLHCSDELMSGCVRLAREFGCSVHTHLAESKIQAIKSREKFGQSLTEKLAAIGMLGPHLVAAHAIWLDEHEIDLLAASGSKVSLNPTSNLRLGSGVAPARQLLESGLTLGLGTDSAICSDSLNMLIAMRAAALSYALEGYDRARWLTPREVLRLATTGGAAVLDRSHELGRIARGYRADLVFLDRESLSMIPLNSPVNQVVRCEEGRGVRHVMIEGRFVWFDGKPQTVDLARVARLAQQAVERLQKTYRLTEATMEALEGIIDRYCTGLAARPFHLHRHLGAPAGR